MTIDVLQDLRSRFGEARDQGARPTCLAFATSDAHAARRPNWAALSCEYAFYHAQRRAGRSPAEGASLQHMLAAIKGEGQPVETDWPYLEALPTELDDYGPPSGIEVFRRDSQALKGGMDEIINLLNIGYPSIVIIMLSDAFYSPNPDGIVIAPVNEAPDPLRIHAILAVGYGSIFNKRFLLVRNSWGTSWGLAGYAWLPEAYISPRIMQLALLTEEVDVS